MLAERGYDIVLHYHTAADAARQSVAELRALGVRAEALQANVASDVEVDRLFAEVHREFGRLDVLVTAASFFRSKSMELVTADDLRASLEVDVLGTFLCCQRAGLAMVEQPQGGVIVTIADWAILRPYPNYAAYLIAKGADSYPDPGVGRRNGAAESGGSRQLHHAGSGDVPGRLVGGRATGVHFRDVGIEKAGRRTWARQCCLSSTTILSRGPHSWSMADGRLPAVRGADAF